jgi:hypothetical protein
VEIDSNNIRLKFAELLRRNPEIVDKFLELEYNTQVEGLVAGANDVIRGKAQYIKYLRSLAFPKV